MQAVLLFLFLIKFSFILFVNSAQLVWTRLHHICSHEDTEEGKLRRGSGGHRRIGRSVQEVTSFFHPLLEATGDRIIATVAKAGPPRRYAQPIRNGRQALTVHTIVARAKAEEVASVCAKYRQKRRLPKIMFPAPVKLTLGPLLSFCFFHASKHTTIFLRSPQITVCVFRVKTTQSTPKLLEVLD